MTKDRHRWMCAPIIGIEAVSAEGNEMCARHSPQLQLGEKASHVALVCAR